MSRYDQFNPNTKSTSYFDDDKVYKMNIDQNDFWILPFGEPNPETGLHEMICYPFYIHKIPGDEPGQTKWAFCLKHLFGWRVDCPFCEKSKELWDSGVKEDQKFAGSFITRKIKYLLNVVPCEAQEVKIMVSDPRVVGKPPRWKDGEQEKVFNGSGTLLNIHLAIDKKTYEVDGTETYACPEIVGANATHVIVHRTKPEGSQYEQYSVAIPAIESHQKKLPNYVKFLEERYDLEAFCKEVVVQTLTAEELSFELERVLNGGVTEQKTVEPEPESEVAETATEPEPETKNEETKPDCFGDYGKLPNGICEKVCKDWQVTCKEASK